ncbi:hypothetical protein ACFXPY_05520 [Streptomyces sp. NPDC059153]
MNGPVRSPAKPTGKYFDQFTESPAHEHAYDTTARTRLAALTRNLLA